MAGLDQRELNILEAYAKDGNRLLYWNYLAQHPGSDSYGLLALGVVRNDNMPGAVANSFAQNRATEVNGHHLSEREWETFGRDLIDLDFQMRRAQLANRRPDLALNLPVKDIQEAHDTAFNNAKIDPNAWTPRQLLEAARRHGGESAADAVWRNMLNSNVLGGERLVSTLKDVAWQYNDEKLSATRYTWDLGMASAVASRTRSYSDPNVVGDKSSYSMRSPNAPEWTAVSSSMGMPLMTPVRNPRQINELEDARAVRMERQQKAAQFAPADPNKDRPLARSPFTFAENLLETPPATRSASLSGPPSEVAEPHDSVEELFERLVDAAMAKDDDAMRAVARDHLASPAGQALLQAGREHNQAAQDAALAQERSAEAVIRGPVRQVGL